MKKIFAIAWKDAIVRFASSSELLFFIILPLVFTFLLAGGPPNGNQDNRIRLLVVDEAQTVLSKQIITELEKSSAVRPEVTTREDAQGQFDNRRASAIGIRNLKKSLVLTFNGLIDQFNANGIVLIISAFLQTAMVPVFTTIRTVTNTVSQLTMLVTGPLVPELIRYHSTGQFEKTQHIFSTNWLISGLIVNLPMVILIPIIQPIYMWWTAGQLEFNYSLFFLLSLSVCLMNFGRSYSNYLIGINYLNALSTITLSKSSSFIFYHCCVASFKRANCSGMGYSFGRNCSIMDYSCNFYKACHKRIQSLFYKKI